MIQYCLRFANSYWKAGQIQLILNFILTAQENWSSLYKTTVYFGVVESLYQNQKEISCYIVLLHEGCPGISRMKELARSYIWWPNIYSDLETQVKQCNQYQLNQPSSPAIPLHPWEVLVRTASATKFPLTMQVCSWVK